MQLQVMQLKTSRDKLLSELDIQFVEAERLNNESNALSQVIHLKEPYDCLITWKQFQLKSMPN